MTTHVDVSPVPGFWDPAEFVRIVLRGFGQVMFQGNWGTGILFVAGIALGSPLMAIGAIVGGIIGPVVATFAHYDRDQIHDGIYGFNPVLVGVGTLAFLQPTALTWALLAVGCVVATFVTYGMRHYLRFPTYTAPFVVVTWVIIIIAHGIAGGAIDVPPAPPETPVGFVRAVLSGAAQVMFGATGAAGLLFLVGIALSNWRHAVIALLGSVVGTLLALYHNNPAETIDIGIYGYNASLAAMAIYLWRKSLLLPILAAAISIPLVELFPKGLGVPALTAPFVVSAWIVIAIGQLEAPFERGETTG